MNGKGILIGSFFVIAALLAGLFVGERVGEKVAAARLEPQARDNAERIVWMETEIAALTERLADGIQTARLVESEILRLSAGRTLPAAGSWAERIVTECGEDVPPGLVVRLIALESSFRAGAVSDHGAIGLGQIKPTTAGRTASVLLDPMVNISEVVRHLRDLYTELRDWGLVLVAYNMGRNAAPVRYAAAILGE
jgi:soluble lytic murein transglycosylase-like protein